MEHATILHLSDLHFGWRFNQDKWQDIKKAIVKHRPDLLVITGDLMNTPWRWSVRKAARRIAELREKMEEHPSDKAKASGQGTLGERVVLVPGNHDTRIYGLLDVKWLVWFALPCLVGAGLAVDGAAGYLAQGAVCYGFLGLALLFLLLRGLTTTNLASAFGAALLSRATKYEWLNVGILPIDSASARTIGAQGRVPRQLRNALERSFGDEGAKNGVWIAAVHHHPLPIPYDSNNESAMIMTNAGSLLKELANFNIPIVLHGHKHNQYFSRAIIRDKHGVERTISVLAAGTPTEKKQPHPNPHSFNLIKICNRLTVNVEVYNSKSPEGFVSSKDDSIALISHKMQAEQRLAELERSHALTVERVVSLASIDEYGNCRMVRELSGVRNNGDKPVSIFPYPFSLRLDTGVVTDVFGGCPKGGRAYCRPVPLRGFDAACEVTFTPPLAKGNVVDFNVGYFAMNFCALNRWQFANMYQRNDWMETMSYHMPPGIGIKEFYMQLRFPAELGLPEDIQAQMSTESGVWTDLADGELAILHAVPMVFARIVAPPPGSHYRFTWSVASDSAQQHDKSSIAYARALHSAHKVATATRKAGLDNLLDEIIDLARDQLVMPARDFPPESVRARITLSLYSFDDVNRELCLLASGATGKGRATQTYRFGVNLPGMAFKTGKVVFYDKNLPHGKRPYSNLAAEDAHARHQDLIDRENDNEEVMAIPVYVNTDDNEADTASNGIVRGAPFGVIRLSVDGISANLVFHDTPEHRAHATFCAAANILLSRFVRSAILE